MNETINRFWALNKRAKFTHLEVHLYFKLLELNSKLEGDKILSILSSHLQDEVRTKAKGLVQARKKLIDWKLIEIKKGTTRKATTYKILYLPKETNPNLYLPKETNQQNTTSTQSNFDLSFVSTDYIPLVKEFIRYRKQDLKSAFKTIRGVKMFYEELIKLSGQNIHTANELVEHAKNREWKTVFPIKKEKKAKEKFRNKQEYSERL